MNWSFKNEVVCTWISGGVRGFQLFALSWWSSSNFRLMFSMDSWSMSQKPARSWEMGRGCAFGFWDTTFEYVDTHIKNTCSYMLDRLSVRYCCYFRSQILHKNRNLTRLSNKSGSNQRILGWINVHHNPTYDSEVLFFNVFIKMFFYSCSVMLLNVASS